MELISTRISLALVLVHLATAEGIKLNPGPVGTPPFNFDKSEAPNEPVTIENKSHGAFTVRQSHSSTEITFENDKGEKIIIEYGNYNMLATIDTSTGDFTLERQSNRSHQYNNFNRVCYLKFQKRDEKVEITNDIILNVKATHTGNIPITAHNTSLGDFELLNKGEAPVNIINESGGDIHLTSEGAQSVSLRNSGLGSSTVTTGSKKLISLTNTSGGKMTVRHTGSGQFSCTNSGTGDADIETASQGIVEIRNTSGGRCDVKHTGTSQFSFVSSGLGDFNIATATQQPIVLTNKSGASGMVTHTGTEQFTLLNEGLGSVTVNTSSQKQIRVDNMSGGHCTVNNKEGEGQLTVFNRGLGECEVETGAKELIYVKNSSSGECTVSHYGSGDFQFVNSGMGQITYKQKTGLKTKGKCNNSSMGQIFVNGQECDEDTGFSHYEDNANTANQVQNTSSSVDPNLPQIQFVNSSMNQKTGSNSKDNPLLIRVTGMGSVNYTQNGRGDVSIEGKGMGSINYTHARNATGTISIKLASMGSISISIMGNAKGTYEKTGMGSLRINNKSMTSKRGTFNV